MADEPKSKPLPPKPPGVASGAPPVEDYGWKLRKANEAAELALRARKAEAEAQQAKEVEQRKAELEENRKFLADRYGMPSASIRQLRHEAAAELGLTASELPGAELGFLVAKLRARDRASRALPATPPPPSVPVPTPTPARTPPLDHPVFTSVTIGGAPWLRFVYYVTRIIMRIKRGEDEKTAYAVELWTLEGSRQATSDEVSDCVRARMRPSNEEGQGAIQVLHRTAQALTLNPPTVDSMKRKLNDQDWWSATGS